MPRLIHETDFDGALSILRTRAIFGANYDDDTHEAYPHFLHERYMPQEEDGPRPHGGNWLPVDPQIRLIFQCDLPEVQCRATPPMPGVIHVHYLDDAFRVFWQCTIHPGTPEPLAFVGYETFGEDIPGDLERELAAAKHESRLIYARWRPNSAAARKHRQGPLIAPKRGFLSRLLGGR